MVTQRIFDVVVGAFLSSMLAAAVLLFPVSLVIRRLYRRAVRNAMSSVAGAAPARVAPSAPPAPPPPGPELVEVGGPFGAPVSAGARALVREGERARHRLAAAYAAAGAAFALAMAVLYTVAAGQGVLFGAIAAYICAWPALLIALRAAAPGRRIVQVSVAGYLAVGMLPGAEQFAGTFGMMMVIPTVLAAMAWSRVLGANAPLVLAALVMVAGVAMGGIFFVFGLLGPSYPWHMAALGGLLVLAALSMALRASARRLVRLYQRKRLSDEMLVADATWALMSVWMCHVTITAREERPAAALLLGALALAQFAVYRLTLGAALRASGVGAGRPAPVKLLVLRVFGARARSERLFTALGRRWRYLGSMNLIAGTDLATLNLEPHELLEFIGGRLSTHFVRSEAGARAAVEALDHAPDPDGRYRSNELFCHDDTWRVALGRVAETCDAVLLDLRGFTPENRGCVFELEQMIHRVALRRVVLVWDTTTHRDALEMLARRAWAVMAADAPNRLPGNGVMRLHWMEHQTPAAVDELVALLCDAAASASAENVRPAAALAGSA